MGGRVGCGGRRTLMIRYDTAIRRQVCEHRRAAQSRRALCTLGRDMAARAVAVVGGLGGERPEHAYGQTETVSHPSTKGNFPLWRSGPPTAAFRALDASSMRPSRGSRLALALSHHVPRVAIWIPGIEGPPSCSQPHLCHQHASRHHDASTFVFAFRGRSLGTRSLADSDDFRRRTPSRTS